MDVLGFAETLGILRGNPSVNELAGRLPFSQLVTLIGGSSLYIGPDTSVTHLAAACAVPMVALYGPVDPCLWGQWPQGAPSVQPLVPRALAQRVKQVIVLPGPQPCVPCNQAGCERHDNSHSDCLESLTPQRVLDQARTVLREPAHA